MLLDGKKLLVTGVLTKDSIAFAVARLAQEQGAELVLTSFGRGMRLTERVARTPARDRPTCSSSTSPTPRSTTALAEDLRRRWGTVDGVLHAIGFAPEACLGQATVCSSAGWDDVATALQVSAYSLKSLARRVLPLMPRGGSIVGLDFDAAQAWPAYDWMGVAKAALESTSRYLARDLGPRGIRVNLVAAGPLRTLAARSIPGFAAFEDAWGTRAPLGWDVARPRARWPGRAWRCCPTGSRPPPARSSTSTAASTRWRWPRARPGRLRAERRPRSPAVARPRPRRTAATRP